MTNVVCPELGEGIENATVACWHVTSGQSVTAGEDIVELVTDKATFSVEAPVDGIVKQVCFEKGQEAPIGGTLAVIEQVSE